MHPSRNTLALRATIVCVAMIVVAWPAWAFAAFGTSSTNPNMPEWRGGWGNSLYPEYSIEPTSFQGFIYTVDRTPGYVIDTGNPSGYLQSPIAGGTLTSGKLDIKGTYDYPPLGGWLYSIPGMNDPLEGWWYWHLAFYTQAPTETVPTWSGEYVVPIGIDLTPPTAVTNVRVSPSASVPGSSTAVGAGTRATVSWDKADYDALSGTAGYKVYVDGAFKYGMDAAAGDDAIAPPLWYIPGGGIPAALTIEDLVPGRHTVQVTATDRALNEGALSPCAVFYSDPDTPTVVITEPAGSILRATPILSAEASDAAGIDLVTFELDGVVVGQATTAPYTVVANLWGFTDGARTLVVKARDMYGRVGTATKVVTLDKTVPKATSYKLGPNPFYPIRHDGYKDHQTASFRLNKRAKCVLEVTLASTGEVVRTLSATYNAGARSFTWDGRWSDGKARTGNYYVRIKVYDGYTDSSGAATYTSTGKVLTKIRSYQIVKLSRNRVKVIPR